MLQHKQQQIQLSYISDVFIIDKDKFHKCRKTNKKNENQFRIKNCTLDSFFLNHSNTRQTSSQTVNFTEKKRTKKKWKKAVACSVTNQAHLCFKSDQTSNKAFSFVHNNLSP